MCGGPAVSRVLHDVCWQQRRAVRMMRAGSDSCSHWCRCRVEMPCRRTVSPHVLGRIVWRS
eukprot:6291301-Prymnesium_polylepis.2